MDISQCAGKIVIFIAVALLTIFAAYTYARTSFINTELDLEDTDDGEDYKGDGDYHTDHLAAIYNSERLADTVDTRSIAIELLEEAFALARASGVTVEEFAIKKKRSLETMLTDSESVDMEASVVKIGMLAHLVCALEGIDYDEGVHAKIMEIAKIDES